MVGTAILLFSTTSVVIINFGNDAFIKQFIPDQFARLFLTGVMIAGTKVLVVISPLGKRSGGHLNPAITLPFWLLKMMHRRDLVGFIAFQFIGATIGSVIAMVVWGKEFWNVGGAVILPASDIPVFIAFLAETAMTFILAIAILIMVSHHSTTKYTPLVVWVVITLEIVLGGQISGTGINPARSFGPAMITNLWQDQWVYLTAPPLGAIIAATAFHFKIFGSFRLKTGKLFHTPFYKCIFVYCVAEHASKDLELD